MSLQTRIFLTVWMVYSAHFATNIVREHYPAFSLAERGTLRVDPYLGLHPDLFAHGDRGAFINNNPGASIFGGLVYAPVRPLVDQLATSATRPKSHAETAPAYNDPRPLRREFFRTTRERGLDLRFGLAAAAIQVLGMAPLGALAALAIFGILRREGAVAGQAALLALLYAFATPIFFRSATLNHNLLVAHLALFSFAVLHGRSGSELGPWHLLVAGTLAGSTVLTDFSGVVPLLAIGLYALATLAEAGRARSWCWMAAGTALPIAALLVYQAWAFGNPWLPAQYYMPETHLSTRGWNGFSVPTVELLLRNLFDPRYGLFAFGPLLLLAFAGVRADPGWERPPRRELWLIWGMAAGILLFTSANQYALLQWNTGFRMLAVAVPFLYLPTARALAAMPRRWASILALLATLHAWALAMTREDAIASMTAVARNGLQLPWLTSLWRAGPAYLPLLEITGPRAWPIFGLLGLALWAVWRSGERPLVKG